MTLQVNNLSKLTDEELLSAILSKQSVCELLEEYGSVQNALLYTCQQELEKIQGIGRAKAKQIQCVRELAERLYVSKSDSTLAIHRPKDIFERMRDMQSLPVEQFRVIYLNTKNRVLFQEIISQGTLQATVVGPREVFCRAIRLRSAALILVHNHPSGDPEPSSEDCSLTKIMVAAGKVIGISVLDHLVVGKGRYISFKERGLLE